MQNNEENTYVAAPVHPLVSHFMRTLALSLLLFGCVLHVHAQDMAADFRELGAFPSRIFTSSDYDAHPQNWIILSDSLGHLYTGNSNGMLHFDGTRWRLYRLPNPSMIRALALDGDRIWAGGHDEIGYFAPNAQGQLTFTSFIHHFPDSVRDFYDVNRIEVHATGVYILTDEHVMRWHNEAVTVLAADEAFQRMYQVDGILYIQALGRPLQQVVGDTLLPLAAFADITQVSAMVPLGEGCTLIASATQGLYVYDGQHLTPYRTEADARLRADDVFLVRAEQVGGLLVLMLAYDEILLLDRSNGAWLRSYRVGESLPMPTITMGADPYGRLWLALDDGLMYIDLMAPATQFGPAQGVSYTVFEVARHEEQLYAASPDVLLQLQPATAMRPAHFEPVQGAPSGAYAVLSTPYGLLGSAETVWHLHQGRFTSISEEPATVLKQAHDDPTVVFAAQLDGLATMRYRDGAWTVSPHVAPWDGEAITLHQDAEGAVWVGLFYGGTRRITWPNGYDAPPAIQVFREEQGVPYGEIYPAVIDGTLGFGTWDGVFRYDSTRLPPFFADRTLSYATPAGYDTLIVTQHRTLHPDTVWMQMDGRLGLQQRTPDGAYGWHALESIALTYPTRMFLESPSVGWVGGTGGMVRYDARRQRGAAVVRPPMLSHIRATYSDSVLYGGFGPLPTLAVDYAENDLRFELAAPLLTVPERAQYQVWLEGYDESWSAWSAEAAKEYTNLPEGDYVFHAKVRDGNMQQSPPQTWAFSIFPPWYRTGWAFLLYLLAGAAGVLGLVRWRTDQLQHRAAQLKAEVAERTAEVEAQNTALEAQNARLAEQTTQITEQAEHLRRLDAQKSRFFAHISHEFRTPLTLIQGPVERALAGDYGPLSALMTDHLGITQRSIGQLKHLIDELLELSRLDAEGLQLDRRAVDLGALARQVAASFASLATSRLLTVHIDTSDAVPRVQADTLKIEQVLNNLLSNALKFTEAAGAITLRVRHEDAQVRVEVEDTGVGIPAEDVPHLFDLFYQASNSSHYYAGGTGIGLALAKEIAEAHGGHLTVQSTLGQGTCFTLTLPVEQVFSAYHGDGVSASTPQPIPVAAAMPEVEAPAAELAHEAQPIVLVVEDHDDLRAYVSASLAPHYQVLTASDGQEALAIAHTTPPDLVLTDLMMPKMDGFKLLEALRDDEVLCATPVILLTARDAEQDRLDAWALRADAYIAKPFKLEALRARINGLLALRRQLQQRYRQGTVAPSPVVSPSTPGLTTDDQAFLDRVHAAIHTHLATPSFGAEALANTVFVSPRHLRRKLKALTGYAPLAFIRQQKLQHARTLLAEDQVQTLTEAAQAIGFSNVTHFARLYEEAFGQPPAPLR
ncbi:MAG: hypothetical protein RhofKO_40210 [Rhodothermales bacterium]